MCAKCEVVMSVEGKEMTNVEFADGRMDKQMDGHKGPKQYTPAQSIGRNKSVELEKQRDSIEIYI